MLDPREVADELQSAGFDMFSTVPCSILSGLLRHLGDRPGHITATDEGNALAIAAGGWLAGATPAVLVQNSGIGNLINPLATLIQAFRIPVMILTSMRGDDSDASAPQHHRTGAATRALLELFDVPPAPLSSDIDEVRVTLRAASDRMAEHRTAAAFTVSRGVLASGHTPYHPVMPPTDRNGTAAEHVDLRVGGRPPSRIDALETVLAQTTDAAAMLATTGKTCRELYTVADRPQHFYQVGSMGCVSSIGLGVAARTSRPVVVLDGDGAAQMRLGSLATIGAVAPEHLVHVVLDNGVHDSTGAQPTARVDFAGVAASCGYQRVYRCDDTRGFAFALTDAAAHCGPALIHLDILSGGLPNPARPALSPPEIAQRFRDFVIGAAPKPAAPRDRITVASRPEHPALPAHIRFGRGISDDLVELIDADPVARTSRRPLVVVGRTSRNEERSQKMVSALQGRFGADLTVLTRLGDQLTLDEADRLLAAARPHDPDLVIGIGGGSVLDAAKTIAMLSGSAFTTKEAAANQVSVRRVIPVVAVPTTPGSGSEATPTATVWDVAAGRKLALDDPRAAPRLAVVDPLLSRTLPLRALAAAALDALAHGVESAWSTRSTVESRAHALRSVGLIATNLAVCLRDRENLSALSAVSLGAAHGGVAIATTKTTLAHALSYRLTTAHQLAHGHACALTLGPVARFNAEVAPRNCTDPRGADFVRSTLDSILDAMGVESVLEMCVMLTELCQDAGLPTLGELGDVDATSVVNEARSYDRSAGNPRRLDVESLVSLLDHRSRS